MIYTYLLINLASMAFPFAFSFERTVRFVQYWRYLFPAMLITCIPFLLWDQFFSVHEVWGFNEKYVMPVRLGKLPLEEIMFFFAIPYASIFIYAAFNRYFPKNGFFERSSLLFSVLFLIASLAGVVLFYDRWYTVVNCSFAVLLLSLQLFFIKGAYMGKFWRFYFIHLIPFFTVNGILTGTWLEEPVVWYNNAENVGIRIGTVPLEDTVYSLSLMLMNITLMEFFRSRNFVKDGYPN